MNGDGVGGVKNIIKVIRIMYMKYFNTRFLTIFKSNE